MTRFIALSLALGFAAIAPAEEWGDVTGTFLYDGVAPKPEPLEITKDGAICGKHKLVDESLVVGKDGGLKNVLLWIYTRKTGLPPIHPSYVAKDVLLDNSKCLFSPRVSGLWTKETLVLGNSDPVGHNAKLDFFANDARNDAIPPGAKLRLVGKINVAERVPTPVSCGSHSWMKAHLLVQEHPYFAVTDENGKFTIKNVPAGEWTFKVWHERSGYVDNVHVDGAEKAWKLGAVTIKVGAGENSLGVVKVKPDVFDN